MTDKQAPITPHGWLEDAEQYDHAGPCDPETCLPRHMLGCGTCTAKKPCDRAPARKRKSKKEPA